MHERVEADTRETPGPAAVPVGGQGPLVQRMLMLQRSAGNAAVTRLLARQTPAGPMFGNPTEFVFILGAKDDDALATAKAHYRSPLMDSPHRKVIVREDMS